MLQQNSHIDFCQDFILHVENYSHVYSVQSVNPNDSTVIMEKTVEVILLLQNLLMLTRIEVSVPLHNLKICKII